MISTTSADSLLTDLIDVVFRLNGSPADRRLLRRLEPLGLDSGAWRLVLERLPFDSRSFELRFGVKRDEVIQRLHAWRCRMAAVRHGPRARQLGYLGVLLLTLQTLHDADRSLYLGTVDQSTGAGARPRPLEHDCESVCHALLADNDVRRAIVELYSRPLSQRNNGRKSVSWWQRGTTSTPDRAVFPAPVAADPWPEWEEIDVDSLAFHKHGTTSFILRGRAKELRQGARAEFALKCVLFPCLRIPAIVEATRSYQGQFNVHDRMSHLVHIWASSDSWILMDFVPGETLAELLQRESAKQSPTLRIDLLDSLAPPLFEALEELEACGLRHEDLSPSNIIVVDQGEAGNTTPALKLIDLGRNYLYLQSTAALEGPEAGYVAPEVKRREETTERADLYSLGRLLIALSGLSNNSRGPIPDALYAQAPLLARFIEDLSDTNPAHRLLIFQAESQVQTSYRRLAAYLSEELEAIRTAQGEAVTPSDNQWLRGGKEMLFPLSGMPRRIQRLRRVRRDQGTYRDPRRSMYIRWLLTVSWTCALAWFISALVVTMWLLRDLGFDVSTPLLQLLQRITGKPESQLPFIDDLRAVGYEIPNLTENLSARLAGLSFAFAGAKYYQNIYAGLTPLVAGVSLGKVSRRAWVAEFFMRLHAFFWLVPIMVGNLVQPLWWAPLTAGGMTVTFLTNWTCGRFAQSALDVARKEKLSTAPAAHQRIVGLEMFQQWTRVLLLYVLVLWVFAALLQAEILHDGIFYASIIALINIVMFYAIKCGMNAPDVRVGLTRCFLAAERVRYMHEPRELARA